MKARLALRSAKLLMRLKSTSNTSVIPLTQSNWKKPERA